MGKGGETLNILIKKALVKDIENKSIFAASTLPDKIQSDNCGTHREIYSSMEIGGKYGHSKRDQKRLKN